MNKLEMSLKRFKGGFFMKKDLLLSVHSKYAIEIVKGQKTVELRRKFPLFEREDKRKIFIYACSPISKIIGECDLKEVKRIPLRQLWKTAGNLAMIDLISFQRYFENCDFGFALYLENPLKYEEPVSLKKVLGVNNRPPQSYRYMVA